MTDISTIQPNEAVPSASANDALASGGDFQKALFEKAMHEFLVQLSICNMLSTLSDSQSDDDD